MAEDLNVLTQQIEELRARVRQLRRERMDIENGTGSPVPLRVAIQQANRDRDAVVSPAVQELRARASAVSADLSRDWAAADSVRWIMFRLRESGTFDRLSAHGRRDMELVEVALSREAALRGQIDESLRSAGVLGFSVPSALPVPEISSEGQ